MDMLLHSECGIDNLTADEMDEVAEARRILSPIVKKAKKTYLAYVFLAKSNNDRFRKLNEELQNDFTKKQKNYPESVTDSYNLLTSYKTYKPRNHNRAEGSSGMPFTNVGNNNNTQGNRNNNNNNNNNQNNNNNHNNNNNNENNNNNNNNQRTF